MKYTKVQIMSALIGIGAFLDTTFQLLTDNASLLIEVGVKPKWVSVLRLAGLIVGLFSTSLLKNKSDLIKDKL